MTLFDNNFLPIGLCLHHSLMYQAGKFRLWIICMDLEVERNLRTLELENVELIPVSEIEDSRLLSIKASRTRGEYCWTVTPFTPEAVFCRSRTAVRVTYLDADVFFFSSPKLLLDELDHSGKDVLITEHAYDPRYDRFGRSRRSGRFCVQFMTFRRSRRADKVLSWWQDRCLEWCFARSEDGKFGDQKYLDQWPALFGDCVHVLSQKEKTLAPWNIQYYARMLGRNIDPVMYHFHGFRIISKSEIMLYSGYRIGIAGEQFYQTFIHTLIGVYSKLRRFGIPMPEMPMRSDWAAKFKRFGRRMFYGEEVRRIDYN